MNKKKNEPIATQPNISANAKTHTDIVKEIQRMQAEAAANNPPPEGKQYDFSGIHLHIGLPCYGGMLYESTMTSFIQFVLLATKLKLSWSLDTMTNESLVTRARNNLCAKMMNNKAATHMLFIDSDIRFKPESIFQMLAAEKDIIAGLYCKKAYPLAYNINLGSQTKMQGPLFTVDTAATGFLLFRRSVYEALIAAHPETKYRDDISLGAAFVAKGESNPYEPFMYSIFDTGIQYTTDAERDADLAKPINERIGGNYLSEDWMFCRRAKALGYDIWVDGRVLLNHTGTHEFCGNLETLNESVQSRLKPQ